MFLNTMTRNASIYTKVSGGFVTWVSGKEADRKEGFVYTVGVRVGKKQKLRKGEEKKKRGGVFVCRGGGLLIGWGRLFFVFLPSNSALYYSGNRT